MAPARSLAEGIEHGGDGGVVQQADDGQRSGGDGGRGVRGDAGALGHEGLGAGGGAVPDGDGVAGAQQGPGQGRPHRTEAQDGDRFVLDVHTGDAKVSHRCEGQARRADSCGSVSWRDAWAWRPACCATTRSRACCARTAPPSGYREYAEEDVDVVHHVRTLLAAGLSTTTIAELLPCMGADGPRLIASCPELLDDLQRERDRLTAMIDELTGARDGLDAVIATAGPDEVLASSAGRS